MGCEPIAEIDARAAACVSAEATRRLRDTGFLVIHNLVSAVELAALRAETLPLVERAAAERVWDIDYQYKLHETSGREVPYRIEYIVDKSTACRALLGHPFILRSVERLQGEDFIPTWDSMVFKVAGAGAAIEWHRDADATQCDPQFPIFNVDIYLDGSDETNCLWAIPGSNRWTDSEADATCAQRNAGGFHTDQAVPLPLAPGDALFHDILLVHGSPACESGLRRVLYYEFRPAQVELRLGPHTAEYIPLKRRVLEACLRERAASLHAANEVPFRCSVASGEPAQSYRVPHYEYWRV